MNNNTYVQIANNYDLWLEFVDINGVITREQFDDMREEDCIAILTDMFGEECDAEQADSVQIEIFESGVWATDAIYRNGGWETGAALSDDEDASDAIYAAIEAQIEAGQTEGVVSSFTWQLA